MTHLEFFQDSDCKIGEARARSDPEHTLRAQRGHIEFVSCGAENWRKMHPLKLEAPLVVVRVPPMSRAPGNADGSSQGENIIEAEPRTSLCSCRPEVPAMQAKEHFGALFHIFAVIVQGIKPRLRK